jgi:hypothetical protein
MSPKILQRYKFDEAKHIHTLDDKPLYGITSVLKVIAKPMLIQWAANMACEFMEANWLNYFDHEKNKPLDSLFKEARVAHRKKKETAGDFGTIVHEAVEKWIKTGEFTETEDKKINTAIKNFIVWASNNKVKFLLSEQPLVSETHWLGGIVDFVCEIGGKLYVGDLKTSSGIYPEYFWQTSGYQIMLEEMGLYKDFHGHIIVNCKKNGEIEVKENYDLGNNKETFLACLKIFKQMKTLNPDF